MFWMTNPIPKFSPYNYVISIGKCLTQKRLNKKCLESEWWFVKYHPNVYKWAEIWYVYMFGSQ